MKKVQIPSISEKFFGHDVRVTTDRKGRAYAIWYRSVPANPTAFNDRLKTLGRKLGATDFVLAPTRLVRPA